MLVAKVQIGLSSRTLSTSARAMISSPMPTALWNFHSTPRKTVPGPGKSSATSALRRPGSDTALHDEPAEYRTLGQSCRSGVGLRSPVISLKAIMSLARVTRRRSAEAPTLGFPKRVPDHPDSVIVCMIIAPFVRRS